jgi:hypothetical protein
MKNILLFILAVILLWILGPIFILLAPFLLRNKMLISTYFYNVAFSLDQLGNVMGAPLFNAVLLKKNPFKYYGNPDETLSHVTGVNFETGDLTKLGYLIALVLDSIDYRHVEKAAKTDQHN